MIPTLAHYIANVGQREVARRSGVPQPHISAWLRGKRGLTDEKIQAVARACGCELEIRRTLTTPDGKRVRV